MTAVVMGGIQGTTTTSRSQVKHVPSTPSATASLSHLVNAEGLKSPLEFLLWDHYINCFARNYPTCSDSENPFLSCLVPVAVRYEPVRFALLALSGLNAASRNFPSLQLSTKVFRLRALEGCQNICSGSRSRDKPKSAEDFFILCSPQVLLTLDEADKLCLVTTALMLALFGKLSGQDYDSFRPYLEFAQYYFTCKTTADSTLAGVFTTTLPFFLHSLVTYNHLLAMIAITQPPSMVDRRLQVPSFLPLSRCPPQDFVSLLWRAGNDVENVGLADFDSWNGDFNFLPSFSTRSVRPLDAQGYVRGRIFQSAAGTIHANAQDEQATVQEIYRTSSRIYFFRQLRDRVDLIHSNTTRAYPPFVAQAQIRKFTKFAMGILRALPCDSVFNSALLFPLGIIGPELTCENDQAFVLQKLKLLQETLYFDVFRLFAEDLAKCWAQSQSRDHAARADGPHKTAIRLIG
ncbi:hypothetical protein G647_08849 [Cladophialophora carrionii CBS 160.54]|uniref:Transcription factor domain-containing protein n=1 Tax=Cladophialophora carrionii CBS 160.54 TaxID=1279043 RepID=V9CYW9_9EURO|nr:uncharacterized protein G647_08849 [Cladophialophora carrionii CBS 160.54]ETI19835.1 hypothetical protein G647_08849 [Cladophialophora carrionii CBS 160.54]